MVLHNLAERYKLQLNVVLLSALSGMIYIYPFDSSFRFTLGCVVLSVMLLYFRQLPLISTIVLSGAAIFCFRTGVSALFGFQTWEVELINNFPALFYYFALSAIWYFFDIRGSINNMAALVLKLSVADIVSNVAEFSLRQDIERADYEKFLISVIAVGVIRAILAFYGYYSLKKYQNFVLASEQLERYAELTFIIAKLRAELFYLHKSSQNIEEVMEQSYWLYNELNMIHSNTDELGKNFAERALTIARSIHEIKKDYYRVSSGIENVLKQSAVEEEMALSEIMFIIEQNTLRFLSAAKKQIKITFPFQGDMLVRRHYDVVSILDNLIMNAIDACHEAGNIEVSYRILDNEVILSVHDDGCGINKSDYFVIFKPGYSTKFSPYTGKMSTGLGLAHVKDLVERLGGSIKVSSAPGDTCFTVHLPITTLNA